MPKQNRYEVKALSDGKPVIYIYGDIGEDFWAEQSNDAKSLVAQIDAIPKDTPEIDFRLFSYGGSVADAVAIYNAASRHPAKINTYNDGVCMSAMSLIFMVGDNRYAAANSILMIHAPMTGTFGNAKEHRLKADMLDRYADAMNPSYSKSGQGQVYIESLLKDGDDHYFTADEALDYGFATELTEAVEIAASGMKLDRFQPPAAWVAANHLNREETTMPEKQTNPATNSQPAAENEPTVQAKNQPAQDPNPQPAARSEAEVLAAEKTRRTDVRAVFAPFTDREGVKALLDTALDNPEVTVEAAQKNLLKHLGTNAEPLAGDARISVGATAGEKFIEGAGLAIMARAGHGKRDRSNPFNGASLMDMARASLDIANINHRGMDKREVVGAAFTHSTSDFPNLLEDVMHKLLLTAYAAAPDTWSLFCKTGDLSDFRAHKRYRGAVFGSLDDKTENNEFKQKTISDAAKESITLGTKGNIINLSREIIINDDMGFFTDLLNHMGRASKRTIEKAVYAYLASNPTMSDSKALFHADHNNLAASGAALASATLTAARQAMAQQKDISGEEYLDIMPSVFVGNVAAGDTARELNDMKFSDETSKNQERPNLNRGLFNQIIGSPRVLGTPWYLFADPMDAPVLEVGFLDGNQDPYLEMKEGFTQDGALYKVRLDFGVAAIAWEGAYKNAGS